MKLFKTLSLLLGASALFATPVLAHNCATDSYAKKMSKDDIVAIAASDSTFSTLVAAVKAAGLVEVLTGDGPYTVFAPTNEAFAKLPDGTVESLLKPENKDALIKILTYHVVPGKVMSSDLTEGKVATVEGDTAMVAKGSNGFTIDGANITKADIKASNGVIHVIDSVILPEGV